MANRYWVGGAGTWNTTSTTNWSATSGGAGGASVPTAADSVFFDQAGTYTVTCTGALTCLDFIVSAGTVTFATGTTPTFNVGGSLTLAVGTVVTALLNNVTFNSALTTNIITTNGLNIAGATLTGGGKWTLGSAYTTASNTLTLTSGTFDTAGYALTLSSLSSSNTNVRSIVLNNSTVNISVNLTLSTGTNLTFNAGTSQINFTGASPTLGGSGQTYYNVSFTATVAATVTVTGANTFNNLTIAGKAAAGLSNVTFAANQTINGTFTLSAGTDATCRTFIKSDIFNTTRTLTCAAFSATDGDFQDITIAGAAAPASGTRLGDCKGNSGITFPAAKTVYFSRTGSSNWGGSSWSFTNGGTTDVTAFPLAQDTAAFNTTYPTSGTVTINANYNIGTIDMSARTSSAMTLATGTSTPTIYGNWINGTGSTVTGTGRVTFSGRTAQTITSAGKSLGFGLLINSPGGSVTLQDALTTTTTSYGVDMLAGEFNSNGYNYTGSWFGSTGTASKIINFGSGSLWSLSQVGLFTVSGTSPTVLGTGTMSFTGATAKTFNAGNTNYLGVTLNQGGAGALIIQGSNTFSNITNTYSATGATTITFGNGTTTTVAAFTAAGQATRLLTLNSSTAGTQATIALTGGGTVTTPDYLNVQDLSFTPFATNGTAPYKWYAGANSTNSGNNSGILFAASTLTAYLLLSGTSWTVPANWNNSSNTIHMIGGGGGGAGGYASGNNRAAGGGGGGGGYTKLTNQTLSGTVTYAVGAAGTGGVASNNGGAGGTTSFGLAMALGGGGGSASIVPTSTGGLGGTGTTFNGGAGGAGAFGTTASSGYGGGAGGGAGGPNGAGGAGGNGFGSTTSTNIAGGGGGGNGGGTAGGNGTSATGGTGGNNFGGTGGGASGTSGTLGGGGGGGTSSLSGGQGGSGIDISNTVGGSGGRGATGSLSSGANTGVYGGGGAGGATNTAGTGGTGGAGSQGMIFIIYTPGAVVTSTGNFLLMF